MVFRDESMYPDAHKFNPGRFIKDGQIDLNVRDPEQVLFGWGRRYFIHDTNPALQITREFSRICLGKQFALRVLFLTIARTLATFDISMCLDGDGNPIVPDGKFAPGGVS